MLEFMQSVAVIVPVACLTVVNVAICFFYWRVFARMESAQRDLLKAVCALSEKPAAAALTGVMEATDSIRAQAEVAQANGRRARMMTS